MTFLSKSLSLSLSYLLWIKPFSLWLFFDLGLLQKSPQTESCTDSGAENEGSCHSDQMSNDFSTDDCVDEGICLDSTGSTERVLKPKVIISTTCCIDVADC